MEVEPPNDQVLPAYRRRFNSFINKARIKPGLFLIIMSQNTIEVGPLNISCGTHENT